MKGYITYENRLCVLISASNNSSKNCVLSKYGLNFFQRLRVNLVLKLLMRRKLMRLLGLLEKSSRLLQKLNCKDEIYLYMSLFGKELLLVKWQRQS